MFSPNLTYCGRCLLLIYSLSTLLSREYLFYPLPLTVLFFTCFSKMAGSNSLKKISTNGKCHWLLIHLLPTVILGFETWVTDVNILLSAISALLLIMKARRRPACFFYYSHLCFLSFLLSLLL